MAAPMRKVTLRNIAGHKLRLFLSVMAVTLGTAFVTGSFVFTSTLQGTFDQVVEQGTEGVDAQISSAEDVPGAMVPLSVVDEARDVEGVGRVVADISGDVVLMQADGTPYQTGGPPTEGIPWSDPENSLGTVPELSGGAIPAAEGEIALPAEIAEAAGHSIGDEVQIYTTSVGMIDTTLVGTYADQEELGGYVGVAFTADQARELFTDGERVSAVHVQAADGVDEETLTENLSAAFPGFEVMSGEELREQIQQMIGVILDFVNYFFIAFGLVGLLVGTFIIYNTFSMLVAQRLKELALLRAIGASRRQVTRSVLAEALITGLVGSALGVLGGFGLVGIIMVALEAFDQPLPSSGLAVTVSSIAVPLVLGMIVTLVSAWAPALRAGRVPPVDAMRQGSVAEPSVALRTLIGAYAVVAGVMLGVIGPWIDSTGLAASTVGVGALLLIVGAFLVLPAMARPIAGGIGRIIGLPFGTIGRLAATNAGRNSRRTAATAFALTLGLTLVAAFSTLGASARDSIGEAVDLGLESDLVVQGAGGMGPPIPLRGDIGDDLRAIDSVGEVVTIEYGFGQIAGEPMGIPGASGTPSALVNADLDAGTLDPGPNELIVSRDHARSSGWHMGTSLTLTTPDGEEIPLTVAGVYEQDELLGQFYAGEDVLDHLIPEQMRQTQLALVGGVDGASPEQVRADITAALANDPVATIQTSEEFVDEMAGAVDQMLTVIYALLGLALVIAVLGIVNTLALSVIERRTEIGMLRAVGMKRDQLRRVIVLESVQIAIFGAIVGASMGVFLGWAFVSVLESQGLHVTTIPWGTVAVVLASSAVVGVVASLWPAHRATKVSPLAAING